MRYESSPTFQADAATYVNSGIGVNYWEPATSRPRSGPPRTTPPSTHTTDGIDHPRTPEMPGVTAPTPRPGHSGGSGGHGSTKDKDDKPTEEHPREEPHPRK